MQESKPQIDVSKGFGFQIQPSPAQLLSQPITSAAFSAPEPQQTTGSFENPNYTQPDIQKQHAIYDKISDELDRGYGIDPAKIDKIAKRASDEMGLPSDAPASTRALFFIKKNENNPEIIDEYKMNYFKRLGKDVVSRAANAGSAIAKIANEYEKDTGMGLVEGAGRAALGAVSNFTPIGATAGLAASAFPGTANTIKNKVSSVMGDSRTPQQKARDNLSTFGALGSIASTIVGDTAMGALELADNLVSGGMADRKLYQVMESKGAKDMMDAIAQSRPVQEIISLAEQYPQEAKALGDALSGFMGVFDVATAGGASVLGKQIGKQALSKVGSMGGDSIMQGIKNLGTKGTDMIPQGVKNMGEKVSNMTGSVWTPAKEAVKSMGEAMILKTAGIGPMTKEVAMDLGTKGKIFDDLKTGKVDTMTLFMDNMKKIKRAGENLSDTGKAYKPIRELDIDVDTKEVRSLIDSELEKANIKRNPDGSYSFADSSIGSKKSEKALLETINDVYNRESVKPGVALNIRRKISDRIGSNSDVSDEGRRLITKIREKYNDLLKKQIPGLRELDAKYSAQRAEYDAVKSDFFDKKGEIKSDALSKFINISKDRNRTRLERLSKLSPEADDASRAILAYEDMTNAMGTKTATYAQQGLGAAGLLGAGAGLTSDNPRATTPFGLALIAISNPRVMVSILQKIAKLGNKKIKGTDMKASDFANDLKLKVLNNEFRKSDGEKLKAAIDSDKNVAQIFSMVPVSEGELVKGQTFDLPEGQTKVMEAKAPSGKSDIVEIQAPMTKDAPEEIGEPIPVEQVDTNIDTTQEDSVSQDTGESIDQEGEQIDRSIEEDVINEEYARQDTLDRLFEVAKRNPDTIKNILVREENIPEDRIDAFIENAKLGKVSDRQAKNVMEEIQKLENDTTLKNGIKGEGSDVKTKLHEEAKKYKSADDFIRSNVDNPSLVDDKIKEVFDIIQGKDSSDTWRVFTDNNIGRAMGRDYGDRPFYIEGGLYSIRGHSMEEALGQKLGLIKIEHSMPEVLKGDTVPIVDKSFARSQKWMERQTGSEVTKSEKIGFRMDPKKMKEFSGDETALYDWDYNVERGYGGEMKNGTYWVIPKGTPIEYFGNEEFRVLAGTPGVKVFRLKNGFPKSRIINKETGKEIKEGEMKKLVINKMKKAIQEKDNLKKVREEANK